MAASLETRVRKTAQRILKAMGAEKPAVFRQDTWAGKAIQQCLASEPFRVAFLRFLDVFPVLSSPAALSRHVQEYFGRLELAPQAEALGIVRAEPDSTAALDTASVLSVRLAQMAGIFIAGASFAEAEPVLTALRGQGTAFSADILGEAVVSEREAEAHVAGYLKLLEDLAGLAGSWTPLGSGTLNLDWGHTPKSNISVKPSALYSQLRPVAFRHSVERAKERLREIYRKAMTTGAHVILDMESREHKNLTLEIYKSLNLEPEFLDYPHSGLIVQSYLKESDRDLDDLLSWARSHRQRFTVRLVKGAYWEAERVWAIQRGWPLPVYLDKAETDLAFERQARRLLENHPYLDLACATHNVRTIAWVLENARQLKVPADRLEFQVLYGMADPLARALVAEGLRVRVYAPIGSMVPGMAYLIRRLLEVSSPRAFLRQAYQGGPGEGPGLGELLHAPQEPSAPQAVSSPAFAATGLPALGAPAAAEAAPALSGPVIGPLLPGAPSGALPGVQPGEVGGGSPPGITPPRSGAPAGSGEAGGPAAPAASAVPAAVAAPRAPGASPAARLFRNEPVRDWTLAETREHFAAALQAVRAKLPYRIGPLIGQRERASSASRRKEAEARHEIVSVNPNQPDELVGLAVSADRRELKAAVAAAAGALPGWRETAPDARAEALLAAAAAAREARDELAALEVLEAGKAWEEADADVCEAIDHLEYYARQMLRLGRQVELGVAGESSRLGYVPRGVAVVIAPWNFPLAISLGMVSAALVTGNTVVFKPSSLTPVLGSMAARLLVGAGLPAGVLNFLPAGGAQAGDLLTGHPAVSLVAFTGSKEVGLHILERGGRYAQEAGELRAVIAEMGGKNAVIVDADADLDEAVVQVVRSAFGYQGQKCSACSRVVVLEGVYARFLERLKAAAESLPMGPVEDPANVVGAVIDAASRDRIRRYIDLGRREGKTLLVRKPPAGPGFTVPLAIFHDVKPRSRIAAEEIFGPVLSVFKVKDFEQALAVANDSPYALTGGVFSRSPENLARAARDFRAGNLYLNRGLTGAVVGRQPFGGSGLSGLGTKAGGPDYLLSFLLPRTITENNLRRGFTPEVE
jgi:RHH-type proline utilization regulon transcriptional repressor/proline dehydrogenase/delta 1-pyrroline-5-carboxylate dehydrogenase